jgi:hypothetical protein
MRLEEELNSNSWRRSPFLVSRDCYDAAGFVAWQLSSQLAAPVSESTKCAGLRRCDRGEDRM